MGSLSQKKRNKVYKKTGGLCAYCGTPIHRNCNNVIIEEGNKITLQCTSEGECFHVEHLVPKSKGGSHSKLTNLMPSCPKCNMQKGSLNTRQFLDKCIKKKSRLDNEVFRLDCIIKNINKHLI